MITTFDRLLFLCTLLSAAVLCWALIEALIRRSRTPPAKKTIDGTIRLLTESGTDGTELVRLTIQLEEFAPKKYRNPGEIDGTITSTGTARFAEIDIPAIDVRKKLIPVTTDPCRGGNSMFIVNNYFIMTGIFTMTTFRIDDDR